jgi:hypothetical protein
MGDTADGTWSSQELGGFIRREEARKADADSRHLPRSSGSGPVSDAFEVGAQPIHSVELAKEATWPRECITRTKSSSTIN